MINNDTIVALSTPVGKSAIAVIRISGDEAITLVNTVFKGDDLTNANTHTLHYGFIIHPKTNVKIDEVMVAVMRSPRTFTCENCIEISCHGSTFIVQKIIEVLTDAGCRYATEGEFTKRAFLNGRINLAQAEAVADLIAAETQAQQSIAINNLRGGVSSDLQKLRTQLVDFAALLELELDFGEEDVTFADRKQLLDLVVVITQHLQELYESFAFGNAVKQGINVVIAGSPNAGKSTLLNTLLNDDRALVSEIAGTTRDTIEEVITINGFIFRFIDTAGLRTNTEDTIEQMGIKKTESEIKKARILLYLFDAKNQSQSSVEEALSKYKMDNLKIIAVANKSDLIQNDYELELSRFFINNSVDFIALSAKDKTNINALKHTLTHYIKAFAPPDNQAIVYNERHQIELKKSITSMHEVAAALHNNTSTELVAIDLRVALQHIGYITGEVDIDKDILASIFSKFCIGK